MLEVKSDKTNYDIVAHLYSFFTGFLYILGGGITEKAFRRILFTEFISVKGNEGGIPKTCPDDK